MQMNKTQDWFRKGKSEIMDDIDWGERSRLALSGQRRIEATPFEVKLLDVIKAAVCSGITPSARRMFASCQTQSVSFQLIYSKGRAAKEHIRTHRMRCRELRKAGAITLTQA